MSVRSSHGCDARFAGGSTSNVASRATATARRNRCAHRTTCEGMNKAKRGTPFLLQSRNWLRFARLPPMGGSVKASGLGDGLSGPFADNWVRFAQSPLVPEAPSHPAPPGLASFCTIGIRLEWWRILFRRKLGSFGAFLPPELRPTGRIGFVSHLSPVGALPRPGRIGFVLHNCSPAGPRRPAARAHSRALGRNWLRFARLPFPLQT